MRGHDRASRRSPAKAAVACVAGAVLVGCASLPRQAPREDLAEAERAFARRAGVAGVRAAFIENFAPDGLVFEPAPVRVRDAWPARSASSSPPAQRLEWQPELVDVSKAGDLGWSTGPYQLVAIANGEPVAHGAFFSVWQRQPDGAWRVWLDMGTPTAAPIDPSTWRVQPQPPRDAAQGEGGSAAELLSLDRSLSGLPAEAFERRLAVGARRHRDGVVASIGPGWIAALAAEGAAVVYEPAEVRVAQSGDMAALHGRLRRSGAGGGKPGRYLHVWQRDGGGWYLAAEVSIVGE